MDTQPQYRPGGVIVLILCVLLVGDLLLCLAGAGSGWMEIDLLKSAAAGGGITESAAMENDVRQALIGLAQLLVYIPTVVFFCLWIYRVNANARALGAENMTYTPGWSVGWFFVPFMNLFKPFSAMSETWKASDPYADPVTWPQGKLSPVVGTWWALWLFTGFLGQAAFRMSFSAQDIDGIIFGSWLQFGADALGVPLAITALVLINGLQGRQNLKFMKREQHQPDDTTVEKVESNERPPWMFTNAA